MTLRTPRRRISPRARRRCQAIRNFFQRTFNSLTSPSGIRINSTIAVNVTDLKRKAVRKDRLLNQSYRNLDVVTDLSRREIETSTPTASKGISSYKKCARRLCDGDSEIAETKVLYKTSDNLYTDSYDLVPNTNNELSDRPQQSSDKMNYEEYASSCHIIERKPIKNKYDTSREFDRHRPRHQNHETRIIIENSLSGLDSYDSHAKQILQHGQAPDVFRPCYSRQRLEYSRYLPPEEVKTKRRRNKTKRHKSQSPPRLDEIRRKNKKNRPTSDEYYITDVLKQQYKPLNLLARKASNFSRISAPVCRDQRYSTRDIVMADSDMYTCNKEPTAKHRYACAADVCAMRSVCDTRLYSAHRKPRLRHRRRYDTDYNDSSLYDVVPVKEKSSPKSRRKFIEENLVLNEVPPSPRTQRPRFNLETQSYIDCEDHNHRENQPRRRSPYPHRKPEYIKTFKHDVSCEDSPLNGNLRGSPKLAMRNTTRLRDTIGNDQLYFEHPNEVPPSPTTQRPRLNLEMQNYSDFEDYEQQPSRSRRKRSPYQPKRPEYMEMFRHDVLSQFPRNRNNIVGLKLATSAKDTARLHGKMGTMLSSQLDLAFPNKDGPDINKTQNGDAPLVADKTDNTLCEIKNILKTFLQELKKDSSTSQCDQASGTTNKNSGKALDGSPRESGNETSNVLKNSAASSFNCGLVQGGLPTMPQQFVPSFTNPCCYTSMMPVCGPHAVPCLHNSCRVHSCMCVGAACSHNHRGTETHDAYCSCSSRSRANCTAEVDDTKKECETDELIREIYNYVSQNSSMTKKVQSKSSLNRQTTRFPVSMGKSMHAIRQDAQVGTPPLRSFSKSCEAIASRQLFDTYYAANPSYSDSVLSREAMNYDMPYESNEYRFIDKGKPKKAPKEQPQNSKFVSVLRLLRKNKKNKKETVHEVCQSEQSIEVDVMPRRNNFHQDFFTYAMHGQEFLHSPPQHHSSAPRFEYNYSPYDPRMAGYSNPGPNSERHPYYDYMAAQSAPMYEAHNMQPQIPLCLKEIEVRSIGTQSERKTPYFRVFSQKKKAPEGPMLERPPVGILRDDRLRSNIMETPDTGDRKTRKIFTLNPKVSASKMEPSLYDKIQKDITNNDAKISNVLLKKIFYKRNPFSPQNRFVRTIMEKDTPQIKWRPRFFF